MIIKLSKKMKCVTVATLAMCTIAVSQVAQAEADWYAFTMDNDTFVGNDNGYTNGIFFTWIDTPDKV